MSELKSGQIDEGACLRVTSSEARYFSSLEQGVFELPRCESCGRWHFYPRVCCPFCASELLAWHRPSGQGTVYSTTTVRKAAGGDYCVCLVDLDEGPRIMSTVVGMPPTEVRIGQRVQAEVQALDQGALLVFTAAGARA